MSTTDITLDVLKKIHNGIGELRDGFTTLTRRFDGLEQRFDGLEKRVDGLTEEVRANGRRLDRLETKVDAQGRRLAAVEGRLHELVDVTTLSVTRGLDLTRRVEAIEGRVTALEER